MDSPSRTSLTTRNTLQPSLQECSSRHGGPKDGPPEAVTDDDDMLMAGVGEQETIFSFHTTQLQYADEK